MFSSFLGVFVCFFLFLNNWVLETPPYFTVPTASGAYDIFESLSMCN